MTSSELKYRVQKADSESHFFDRDTMKFFGDTMKNYSVRPARIKRYDGTETNVWELYRKRPVKHGLRSSAYFDKETFEEIISV